MIHDPNIEAIVDEIGAEAARVPSVTGCEGPCAVDEMLAAARLIAQARAEAAQWKSRWENAWPEQDKFEAHIAALEAELLPLRRLKAELERQDAEYQSLGLSGGPMNYEGRLLRAALDGAK